VVTVIVRAVARLLLAPSLVVAAAVLVKGYTDVGDGFSAGVIVALAIALQYIASGPRETEAAMPVLRFAPMLLTGGLLLALAAAFFPIVLGKPPFSHLPPPGAHPVTIGTLELATALAFDIGVFLLVVGALVTLLHLLAGLKEGEEE
jgi:multicomponent Na+:H+ antiporter subunit B